VVIGLVNEEMVSLELSGDGYCGKTRSAALMSGATGYERSGERLRVRRKGELRVSEGAYRFGMQRQDGDL